MTSHSSVLLQEPSSIWYGLQL